jgi:hypothetical protein
MNQKLSEIELKAVNDIVGKKKANDLEKAGISKRTILYAYHQSGRSTRNFNKAVDQTMEETEKTREAIRRSIELTKDQLELLEKLIQSTFIMQLTKNISNEVDPSIEE